MPRYVSLLRFTEQGARAMNKSSARALAFRKAVEKAGVQVEAQYWTVGAYDGVLIINSNDEQAALRALAQLAKAGNVRTETMLALDSAQFSAVSGR